MPSPGQYLAAMGFAEHPFPVVPDARNYFMTDALCDMAHEILFAIAQRKGFVVVSGDVGVGKTTLSRYLIRRLDEQEYVFALILNSYLQEEELLDAIIKDFGLPTGVGKGFQARLDRLNHFFLEQRQQGRNCVLIIDDAQNLSVRSLEAVRLLSNLETESEKLVQILLIGQEELQATLALKVLRQLRSRVALWRILRPLGRRDLDAYVRERLCGERVGRDYRITDGALKRLYAFSGGNLRRANMLLDRALLALLSDDSLVIDGRLLDTCIADIDGTLQARGKGRRYALVLGLLLAFTLPALYLVAGSVNAAAGSVGRGGTAAPVAAAAHAGRADAATLPNWRLYLTRFRLQGLARQTWPLLRRGDLSGVATVVEAGGDYRLVTVPAKLLKGGAQLPGYPLSAGDGRPERMLFIWRPVLDIAGFRVGLASPQVRRLQRVLAGRGLYGAAIDGVVGARTVQSLMLFQMEMGIPVSGRIDGITLLALSHPGMFSG